MYVLIKLIYCVHDIINLLHMSYITLWPESTKFVAEMSALLAHFRKFHIATSHVKVRFWLRWPKNRMTVPRGYKSSPSLLFGVPGNFPLEIFQKVHPPTNVFEFS